MSVRLPKILVLSGSFRKASFNTTLATYCSDYLKSKTQVTLLPPSALSSLPLYSQDLETESIPAPALNLKKIVAEHDAFVIASPEYNSSITPALLNALTWLSRPLLGKDEPTYSSFQGKTAALVSASPGGLGGLRAHNHLRDILVAMNCIVVPQIACIGSAFKAFDQHGSLVDPKQKQMVDFVLDELAKSAGIRANAGIICQSVVKLQGPFGQVV